MKYHAHIYFNEHQDKTARQISEELLSLSLPELKLWKIHEKKVGPHFLPMIEIHFLKIHLGIVAKFLSDTNHGLSILIHEDSGDDFKDHENPIWVGSPLPIDFEFFEKVKTHPSLSVH